MAMIELTFRADVESEDGQAPESASAAAIEHTWFVVPVRFAIDSRELLTFPDAYPDWRPLPVLGFSTQLRETAANLGQGDSGTVTLSDGGFLSIVREADQLVIAASLVPVRASVPRDEFLGVAAEFSRAACDYVLTGWPRMAAHPEWNRWSRLS